MGVIYPIEEFLYVSEEFEGQFSSEDLLE